MTEALTLTLITILTLTLNLTRRTGLGRALCEWCEAGAAEWSLPGLMLQVEQQNHDARALYGADDEQARVARAWGVPRPRPARTDASWPIAPAKNESVVVASFIAFGRRATRTRDAALEKLLRTPRSAAAACFKSSHDGIRRINRSIPSPVSSSLIWSSSFISGADGSIFGHIERDSARMRSRRWPRPRSTSRGTCT